MKGLAMGDDFETLVLRVARLETQNRHFKQAGSFVAVLLLTAIVLVRANQGGVKEVVEAREFVLVDDDGNERGLWTTVVEDGAPYLSLLDKNGGLRSLWAVDNDSSSLSLDSHNGRVIVLNATNAGTTLELGRTAPVKTSDSIEIKEGISLAVPSPSITLWDKNGKIRAILGAAATVIPQIGGVVHKHPESSLHLFDEDGKVLFEAP